MAAIEKFGGYLPVSLFPLTSHPRRAIPCFFARPIGLRLNRWYARLSFPFANRSGLTLVQRPGLPVLKAWFATESLHCGKLLSLEESLFPELAMRTRLGFGGFLLSSAHTHVSTLWSPGERTWKSGLSSSSHWITHGTKNGQNVGCEHAPVTAGGFCVIISKGENRLRWLDHLTI